MRKLLSVCGFALIGGLFALSFCVPLWKPVALRFGRSLWGVEVMLITLSDVTVRYFYILLPAVLISCFVLRRIALAGDGKSTDAEAE